MREQSFSSRPGFESWPTGLGKALGREGLGRLMFFFLEPGSRIGRPGKALTWDRACYREHILQRTHSTKNTFYKEHILQRTHSTRGFIRQRTHSTQVHAMLARVTIVPEECERTPSVTVQVGGRKLACFRPPPADASVFGLLKVCGEHILYGTNSIRNT